VEFGEWQVDEGHFGCFRFWAGDFRLSEGT
jgi:hypothetical protein